MPDTIERRMARINQRRDLLLTSLVAAAAPVPNAPEVKSATTHEWQKRAWTHYDSVGEVWFAINYTANLLSRVRLFVAEQPDPMQPPAPAEGAGAVQAGLELDRLRDVDGTHSQIIHDSAMQLGVPGEGYLVGHETDEDPDAWEVYSTSELIKRDGTWTCIDGEYGRMGKPLRGANVLVHRIWRPHPRYKERPDSPLRAVSATLDELLLLDQLYRSNARSRIGTGVLLVPSEISPPPASRPGMATGAGQGKVQDQFTAALIEALTTPVGDETSAANVAPPVIKAAAKYIDQIKHLSFERDFNKETAARYGRVLNRAISGMDLPNEVIEGIGNSNHWTGWLINQDTFSAHLAPTMQLICFNLTQAFLRPALGVESDKFIWFDASAIMSRPTPDTTLKAQQQIFISDEAARKYTGFTDDDAPTPEEVAARSALQAPAAGGGPTAEAAPADGGTITASAHVRSGLELGLWLAERDRALRIALQQEASKAVQQAVERVARRGVSATAGVADENDDADAAQATVVAAFYRLVSRAQRQARLELRRQGASADRLDAVEERQASDLDRGSASIARSVRASVLATVAEGIGAIWVAAGVVRGALAIAGGSPAETTVHAVTDQPAGGVFTGDVFQELMAELGKTPDAWQWVWGDSERPFDGHAALDGIEFLDWTDDALIVRPEDAWLGISHYAIGDHDGCGCDYAPVYAEVQQEVEA